METTPSSSDYLQQTISAKQVCMLMDFIYFVNPQRKESIVSVSFSSFCDKFLDMQLAGERVCFAHCFR